MGLITNLIRAGEEKKARDRDMQMRAFELASKSDDPQLHHWGIQSLVDMGTKSAADPETKKKIPVIGQMAQLLGGLKHLNPVPGAPKNPEGNAPKYDPARAQAEQERQAGVDRQRKVADEQALAEQKLKERKALDAEEDRRNRANEELTRQRRTTDAEKIGLTGEARNRYVLEGKFATKYGEDTPTGTRKPVDLTYPDGTRVRLFQDNTGKLFNVGGEAITPPAGAKFATAAEKPTDVDRVANHLLLSGKAKDKAEATKAAAGLLADVDKAKAKVAAGGGAALTPQELAALAQWEIGGGGKPSFGLGANNPTRTAYQKALADQLGGGAGVGGAFETRAGFKGGQATLTKLMQAKGNVGGFERNARANIERAVELSKTVGRTGASLANELLLQAEGKLTDYPQLAAFRVAVDTAAKDYALVTTTATMGGVSTDSARAGAKSLFNEAMAQGSLEAAAESMYADMTNRLKGLDAQIDETRKGIRGGGGGAGASGAGETPTTPTAPGGKPKTADEYLKSIGVAK